MLLFKATMKCWWGIRQRRNVGDGKAGGLEVKPEAETKAGRKESRGEGRWEPRDRGNVRKRQSGAQRCPRPRCRFPGERVFASRRGS